MDLMYDVPGNTDVTEVLITPEMIQEAQGDESPAPPLAETA